MGDETDETAETRILQLEEQWDDRNLPEIDIAKLIQETKDAIKDLIETDPLLSELPTDVTCEELDAQIALLQGQAIKIFLDRGNLPKLTIVVPPKSTTILDLKKAIKRTTNLALKRENVHKKISWKHVWKKYNLSYDDLPLLNDHENIDNYGICNKATLRYVKKRKEKNKIV